MSKTEMSNCLDILGYMDGFTEQQYTAIAEKVVMDSVSAVLLLLSVESVLP